MEVSRADRAAGLCADCARSRRVVAKRGGVYVLCERSSTDPAYDKYPRLPVLVCPGYEPRGGRPARIVRPC